MSEIQGESRCPRCGADVAPDASGGLCTRCLLATVERATDGPGSMGPRRPPPGVEEVAAAFPHLEIVERIGVGGMGTVYRARQPKLDRWVALKILSEAVARDPAFAERFLREARVLARLNHPNIVAVYDFGQSGRFCYLLMEYVDGVNLRQAMQAAKFTPAQALSLVPQICEALQFAHDRGVTHRDIKPENILLDARGQVKLADFGIAKLIGESGGGPNLTRTGTAVGTPQYMAPEQIEKPAEVDHRADIYSLGVVFYELLTGELPLGRFAAPSSKTPMDARVDEIVLRALAKERDLRQQSAREVGTQVERLGTDPATAPPKPVSLPAAIGPLWQAASAYRWAVQGVIWPVAGIHFLVSLPVAAWLASVIRMNFSAGWPGGMATVAGLVGLLGSLVAMAWGWKVWLGPLWPPGQVTKIAGTQDLSWPYRAIGSAFVMLAIGLAWNLIGNVWGGVMLVMADLVKRGSPGWSVSVPVLILLAVIVAGAWWVWADGRRTDLREPAPLPGWARTVALGCAVYGFLEGISVWLTYERSSGTVVMTVVGGWVLPACLALWTGSRWWRAVALVAGVANLVFILIGVGITARFALLGVTPADLGRVSEGVEANLRHPFRALISQSAAALIFGLTLWTLLSLEVRRAFGLQPGRRVAAEVGGDRGPMVIRA